MPRKPIGKKLRFEVFKRDSFTCQYCGAKAPDVLLHVDHIDPVADGGSNGILNLTTSCQPCNAGKGKRRLTDSAVLDKQRDQLRDLQTRQEQIAMMMDWQRGLLGIEDAQLSQVADFWAELAHGYALNDNGLRALKKMLRSFPVVDVLDSMQVAVLDHVVLVEGEPVAASIERAWGYVGRIVRVKQADKSKPYLKDLLYTRGILRNRINQGYRHQDALVILEEAYLSGVTIGRLQESARRHSIWWQWKDDVARLTEAVNARTA